MYATGDGVPKNLAEALRLIRSASKKGSDTAQNRLGEMLRDGWGVTKDPAQAARWFRAAAQQGHREAQYNLAYAYLSGTGVGFDLQKAFFWLTVAGATRDIAGIKWDLTPQQRAAAEALAKEWVPKTPWEQRLAAAMASPEPPVGVQDSGSTLPSTKVTLRDATTQCDCQRKLGTCQATAGVRDSQVARVSNGLSSLVVVGLEPPPGQCVEVTAYLNERAVIGGRARTTGHPLYRVIDGPTDVEWRNVGSPATELSYSVAPNEVECHVCARRGSREAPAQQAAANRVRPAGGPYFHAALFEPTPPDSPPPPGWGDAVPALFIGLSSVSAEDAHRRACNWPSHNGMVSQEACVAGTREKTYGHGQTGPYRTGYTQKVLKCGGGGYFAVALSDGPVGVSCGAPSREAAEAQALQACREGWAAKGLPDGGNSPPRRSDIPATCQIDSSALNDGTFASSGTWPGMRAGGNGQWTYCWGSQRRSRFAGLEGRCLDTARHCQANADHADCR